MSIFTKELIFSDTMKRILLTLAACLAAMITLQAQTTKGSFTVLNGTPRVRMVIDFSEADIHGMSEEEFAAYEEDWEIDKPDIIARFMTECNNKCRDTIYVGRYKDAPYEIKVIVHTISVKGDFDCDAFLLDTDGNELGSIVGIREKGGRVGSKLNLIKDGAEHTGALFGTLLQKAIKKK